MPFHAVPLHEAEPWGFRKIEGYLLPMALHGAADTGIGSRHQDLHPLNTTARDLVTRVRVRYERTTGWTLDPARIDLYTVIAELSDLAENLAGESARGVAHHVRQLERWRRVLRP